MKVALDSCLQRLNRFAEWLMTIMLRITPDGAIDNMIFGYDPTPQSIYLIEVFGQKKPKIGILLRLMAKAKFKPLFVLLIGLWLLTVIGSGCLWLRHDSEVGFIILCLTIALAVVSAVVWYKILKHLNKFEVDLETLIVLMRDWSARFQNRFTFPDSRGVFENMICVTLRNMALEICAFEKLNRTAEEIKGVRKMFEDLYDSAKAIGVGVYQGGYGLYFDYARNEVDHRVREINAKI